MSEKGKKLEESRKHEETERGRNKYGKKALKKKRK
jgi:hypothetical protein